MNKATDKNAPPGDGCLPKPVVLTVGADPTEIASSELLQGRSRVLIEHMGERYCLQLTRAGKLILTK